MDWPQLREQCLIDEDTEILALNKPTGISVTGERHDTDIVRMAADHGEKLYPVHRIDKVTSGLILFAKTLPAHGQLTRQFNKRTAIKSYLAIVSHAKALPEAGEIDLPLSVGRKNRVRIAAPRESIQCQGGRWFVAPEELLATKNYPSHTSFTILARQDDYAALALNPHTGRRHQIRVHLAWIGHPILGDPLFEKAPDQRTHLHSWRLKLVANWRVDTLLDLTAPPDTDFWGPVPTPADFHGDQRSVQ